MVYPARPVLDTPGTLSTNIRAGSKVGPQNDSSEKKREGRLAGAPGGASRGERGKHDRGVIGLREIKNHDHLFEGADFPTPGSRVIPSPIQPFTQSPRRENHQAP
jgi:hypothetical protein